MRTCWMLLALLLVASTSATIRADEGTRRPDDDPWIEASIRELVRRGAVVKKFKVAESETQGLLVRLKPPHLDRNGRINPDILAALMPMPELTLELRSLPLSDEGLKSLLAKVTLAGLDLSGSEISDCGLREFGSVPPRLRLLDLSFTRITDEGLKSIASQSELRHLALIECRVTDNSIHSLVQLRKLREVYLAKTGVTSQSSERLKRAIPACRVER